MSLKPLMRPFSRPTKDEPTADYAVLGGNHLGEAVANRLHAAGKRVCVVTESPSTTTLPSVEGDPTDLSTLEQAGVSEAKTVVVATTTDARNLLVAQLMRAHFDVARVVVLTNRPDNVTTVGDAGHEPLCATSIIADAVVENV